MIAKIVSRSRFQTVEKECRFAGLHAPDEGAMEACTVWPHASLSPGYGDPIRSNVPVFLLSGEWDPVSTAGDGEDAAEYLSNAIDVIAPRVHVPGGPCVVAMEQAFLATASPKAVDTSCVATMKMPPFVLDKLVP